MWYCLLGVAFVVFLGQTMMESIHKHHLTKEPFLVEYLKGAIHLNEVCCTSMWKFAAHLHGSSLHICVECYVEL